MPYYVYRITQPFNVMEQITQFDAFKEASKFAKAERAKLEAGANSQIKVIFAENPLQAEDILSQPREKEPITGDDW